MSLVDWLKGLVSKNSKALFLYKRGLEKANKGDHQGAIRDYTAAIEIKGIEPKVEAMALYNRALAHATNEDNAKAVDDLLLVLDMEDRLPQIKKMAKQKLMRIDHKRRA